MIIPAGITAAKPAGGGGGYTASAVHLDGSTWLSTASLTATDNSFISWVGWLKFSTFGEIVNPTIWVVDPEDTYTSSAFITTNAGDLQGDLVQYLYDATASKQKDAYSESAPATGEWHSVIVSLDSNTAAAPLGKIYIDDVDVTDHTLAQASAFVMAFNGLGFFVGADSFGSNYLGDMADLRIMPGVSLLDGGGDIPQATRRLFVTAGNKPVDPAVATLALGAPCILFSGDATGFVTNQGTGGAFTLTGSLTNASTSPSD